MNVWDVEKLFPAPQCIVQSVRDWSIAEIELICTLPRDYKNVVEKYGTFNVDSFLWIFNPFTLNHNLNLLRQTVKTKKIFENIKNEIPKYIPYNYPDKYDLINWASTDNGDRLYWLINKDSNKWIIVINETRSIEWQEFDMTVSEFLCRLLTRQLHVNAFPDTFPSNNPQINYIQ